jgi:hypothetical protein
MRQYKGIALAKLTVEQALAKAKSHTKNGMNTHQMHLRQAAKLS